MAENEMRLQQEVNCFRLLRTIHVLLSSSLLWRCIVSNIPVYF